MTSFDRARALAGLRQRHFDVVVIGAGMTGAGVALDAVTSGLEVALIDAGDIASGTSSKSSKMVHGGLRYLQQKEFRLVYENLRERQRLLDNAPHLVRPLPFLIPLIADNPVVAKALTKGYASALRLYDLTGGWRIGQRYRRLSAAQAREHLPTLTAKNLAAAFLYMDARGDDARVALTLALDAAGHGAAVANYVRAVAIEKTDDVVSGVRGRDGVTGEEFTISCQTVVNASGVWADEIFTMAEGRPSARIAPAKGIHITLPAEKLPADVAAVFSVPGDRRSIFVVPFEEAPFTYVGTTDTHYEGPLDTPDANEDDVAYLLRTVNHWTGSHLTPADVTGVWAGLRPLLSARDGEKISERTADLSRRHQVSDDGDGVIHVTGGKWTTYRQMAEDAVNVLSTYFPGIPRRLTRHAAILGSERPGALAGDDLHLHRRYGTLRHAVTALIAENPALSERPIDGLPYLAAEFLYAAQSEMALTLEDVLTRRTRAHLMDARATWRSAERIAHIIAPALGWDSVRVTREVENYRALVAREFANANLPLETA